MKTTGDSNFNGSTMKKTLKEKQSSNTGIENTADKTTIKFKLIAAMVPIIFIIFLGIVSFLKASEVIESNYKKASEDLIHMASEYMKAGFNSVKSNAILFANDSEIQRYSFSQDDKVQAFVYKDNLGNVLCSKKAADEFIQNIYLMNETVESISSGEGIDEFYKSFKETNLGKIVDNSETGSIWVGEDAFLDKQLNTNPEKYSMRLIQNVINFNAFLIFDVEADVMKNILSDVKFDKTGFLGLVTPDGKEIIDYSLKQEDPSIDMEALKSDKIFVNQAFYKEAMAGEEVSGSEYVEYKGDTYLFQYSKVGDTGATICALMPKSTITSQADSIKNTTIIIVIIACTLTILIETMLSTRNDKQ